MGGHTRTTTVPALGREKASSLLSGPPQAVALATITTEAELASLHPSLDGDVSTSPMSEDLVEERSPVTPTDTLVPAMEASQEDARVGAKKPPPAAEKTERTIAIWAAPSELIRLYGRRLSQMVEVLALKGTELAKARAMDTVQEEIEMLEGQLENLTCSYDGCINMTAWASLPEQHQMTKDKPPGGIGSPRPHLGRSPKTTHGHGGRSLPEGSPHTAMMQQLLKGLEDDYTKLKGSQCLHRCQTPMGWT